MEDELKALEHHCHVDLAQHIVTLIADKESVEADKKKLTTEIAEVRAALDLRPFSFVHQYQL